MYQTHGAYPILKSFVEICMNKEDVLSKIKEPVITVEKGRIDCLIEEIDQSYAIIIENKVKCATDYPPRSVKRQIIGGG